MVTLPGWETLLVIAAVWITACVAFTVVWAMAADYYRVPDRHRRSRPVAP